MQTESKRTTSNAALGMLLGTAIGGGIGVVLFALTQQALFIAFAGVGTAIGLVLGAGADRARKGRDA
jgi:uncharacterized membrane protein YgaE (UPF0421/DUF939 family)